MAWDPWVTCVTLALGFLHLQRPNDAVSSRAGRGEPQYFYCTPSSLKIGGNYVHFFRGLAREGWQNEENTFLDQPVTNLRPKSMNAKSCSLSRYDTLRHLPYKSQNDGWLRRALPEHCLCFLILSPFFFRWQNEENMFSDQHVTKPRPKSMNIKSFYHNYDTLRHIVGATKKQLKNNLRFFRGPDLPRMHF